MTEHKANAVGQQLGKYRLQRLLGVGGFADVYLGEHLHLGTLAAIKILRTKLTNEEVGLFLQEARLIARLSHPHIVRVFDFDVADMVPFLVMDYAPGGTLRQRHPKGSQVPLASIISYVNQIADALQYAHSQKLVHRDIKPENMLIDQRNNIVISDFGVASVAHSTESQTIVELAGTLPYISPEQLQGLPRPASDQYSLAVVVYEWITGSRPFQGTFAEIVSQHMVRTPSPLYGQFPEVTPGIENVLFKALSKETHNRFATIRDFAAALEQAYLEKASYNTQVPGSYTNNSPELRTQLVPTTSMSSYQDATAITEMEAPPTPSLSHPTMTPSNHPSVSAHQPGSFTPLAQHPPIAPMQPPQPRHKQRRMLIAIVVPLFLILLAGGIFFDAHPLFLSGSADEESTVIVLPTATPKLTASDYATQTAVAQKTAIAQASTPEQLYSVVTGMTPTFSDSLATESTRAWTSNTSCVFGNGLYTINSPAGFFTSCLADNTNLCNFAYQVEMTVLSGDGGGGLIFRQADHEYRLRVGPDGNYDLVNGISTIADGNSAAIQKGMHTVNQLTIIAQGSKIDLYINSQYITNVTDNASSCGKIGLLAVNFSGPGQAAFSNAKVWSL